MSSKVEASRGDWTRVRLDKNHHFLRLRPPSPSFSMCVCVCLFSSQLYQWAFLTIFIKKKNNKVEPLPISTLSYSPSVPFVLTGTQHSAPSSHWGDAVVNKKQFLEPPFTWERQSTITQITVLATVKK